MRSIIGEQHRAEVVHGVKQRRHKYALAAVVIQPGPQNPRYDQVHTLPGDPARGVIGLKKGDDMPHRPHNAQDKRGGQRVPAIL